MNLAILIVILVWLSTFESLLTWNLCYIFDNDIVKFRMKLIKMVKFWSAFLFTLKSSAVLMKRILALWIWTANGMECTIIRFTHDTKLVQGVSTLQVRAVILRYSEKLEEWTHRSFSKVSKDTFFYFFFFSYLPHRVH